MCVWVRSESSFVLGRLDIYSIAIGRCIDVDSDGWHIPSSTSNIIYSDEKMSSALVILIFICGM